MLTLRRLARRAPILVSALALVACDEQAPLDPGLARIRRAEPPAALEAQRATYVVSPESRLTFTFGKRGDRPTGTIVGLSGALLLDLHRLSRTRGRLEADLATLSVEAPRAEGAPGDPTAVALAWLGAAGAAGPGEAAARTVRFDLHTIESLTAEEAFAGRRESVEEGATEGERDRPAPEEIRRVDLSAAGELTLNSRRATVDWQLTARFEYPEPALTGAPPSRIVIETRKPAAVVLSVFDILPRNANGTTLWTERSAARKYLGRDARVSARLVLEPDR